MNVSFDFMIALHFALSPCVPCVEQELAVEGAFPGEGPFNNTSAHTAMFARMPDIHIQTGGVQR